MGIFLETKRLILKEPELSDFDDLVVLRTDPAVMQYIGTGTVQTREQIKTFLDNAKPYLEEYGLTFYSVFEKEAGDFVGQAGLFHQKRPDPRTAHERFGMIYDEPGL